VRFDLFRPNAVVAQHLGEELDDALQLFRHHEVGHEHRAIVPSVTPPGRGEGTSPSTSNYG
jgi:hypothetical protein